MKRLFLLLPLIVLVHCSAPTRITGSWKNPKAPVKSYKTLLVAALMHNTVARSAIESDMQKALSDYKINSVKSIDDFPPGLVSDSIGNDALRADVRKKGYSAILTITVLKKETESRYVAGGPMMYAPMGRWGYYGSFWGYYNYWYPYTYNSGYYNDGYTYYFESNLYDGQTDELIWSGQTETYTYDGINSVSKDFARAIVEKMRTDSILH